MDVMNSTDYVTEIENARKELRDLISSKDCAPIMLRLAWNDAATYDIRDGSGGPNGSIRFPREYSHYANHGLKTAIDLCQTVKSQHPMISYADLYQLAGVVAVEVTGGPRINFVHGRKDSNICTREGRLPNPDGDQDHLRSVFYRMGFSDKEIVALSGAHTLGRAHHERSGFEGPWTSEPLKFDNSYFVELRKLVGEGLVKLPTDMSLVRDPALRKHALAYAEDQEAFFRDYAAAHKKFSELGMGASMISKLMQNVTGVAFGVTIGVSLVAVMIVVSCLNGGRRRH